MLPRLHCDVCRSTFLRAARCEPRLLHTLQSVQGCLPDQLFSLAKLRPPGAAARCDKDCTRHEVRTHPVKATGQTFDVETDSVRGDHPGRWIAPAGLSYAAPTPMWGANDDQMT